MLSFIPSFDQNSGQKSDVVNISYGHKFTLYPYSKSRNVFAAVSSAFIGAAICACDSPSFSIGTQQILPQYVRLLSDRLPTQEKPIKHPQTACESSLPLWNLLHILK